MSVQTKITTRKSGKETKRYYATVYDSVAKKSLCGPLREKRSEALTDESKIRREMEMQRKDGASSKVQSKTLTIAELYAAWQPHAQKALAAPTYKVYVGYYNKYIGPVFDRPVCSQKGKSRLDSHADPRFPFFCQVFRITVLSALDRLCPVCCAPWGSVWNAAERISSRPVRNLHQQWV